MSLLKDVNISFKDSPILDAFGRVRVSEPYTILDTKQLVDKLPLFYDELTEYIGSSSHNPNEAATTMQVGNLALGRVVRQTKLRATYQPGKSLLILATFVLGELQYGISKMVGYFDEKNGLFLETIDNTLYITRRSYVAGFAVNTRVAQKDWNIDKLDGTGRSRIILDTTKTQIFIVDLEWLGVGRVRFGFIINGKIYYCHEMNHANILSEVYMSTPNLPIRYEIVNSGEGAASSMKHICSSVVSEGGQQATVLQSYLSRGGTPITLGSEDQYVPIISIRLKSTHIGTRISPVIMDLLATTNINYEWKLFLNPTIAGTDVADWMNASDSSLQFDTTRTNANLVSGGHVLAGGYGSSSNQSRVPITGIANSYLTIGSNIDGSSDELVLAVANIDGTGGTMYGGMLIDEYN